MKIVGLVVFSSACLIHTMGQMGPFDCEVRSFQAAPISKAGKNLIIFHSRQQRLSRKKYNLQMDMQYGIDISDDYMANVVVAKKTPQGWKDNFFQIDAGPACSAMKKFVPSITREMAVGMKLKKQDCPFPRGNYTDLAINPNLDIKSVPAFFYNVFRLRITVFNDTGVMGGFDVMIETSPKKPK